MYIMGILCNNMQKEVALDIMGEVKTRTFADKYENVCIKTFHFSGSKRLKAGSTPEAEVLVLYHPKVSFCSPVYHSINVVYTSSLYASLS